MKKLVCSLIVYLQLLIEIFRNGNEKTKIRLQPNINSFRENKI